MNRAGEQSRPSNNFLVSREEKKMNQLQNVKVVKVTQPGAIVDNAAFTTATIDSLGYRKMLIIVALGALDIALAALKLTNSDASNMASPTDVSGADFSVSPLTLPAATDDNKLYGIHVDVRGKKRYFDVSLTGGDGAAGTYADVTAILFDPEESPATAAERGFAQEAIV
jgi:hypothetical protein